MSMGRLTDTIFSLSIYIQEIPKYSKCFTYDATGNKLRTTVGRQMTFGPFHPSSSGGVAEPQGGGQANEKIWLFTSSKDI